MHDVHELGDYVDLVFIGASEDDGFELGIERLQSNRRVTPGTAVACFLRSRSA